MVEGEELQEEAVGEQSSDYTKFKGESHESVSDVCKANGSIQCHFLDCQPD